MLSKPTQYELWADLALQNKHLRRNNWLHWSIHLVLVMSLLFMALRPLIAIRVDSLGKAALVENVTPLNQPGPEEAQHVAELNAQYLMEATSGSVQRDIGKALKLMTLEFGEAYRAKVKDDPSLAAIEKGNMRVQLTFDPRSTEVKAVKDTDGKVTKYFVQQLAKVDVYRADVLTTPVMTKGVVLRTTLLVVPRTRGTLNGLLVDFFEKEFLEEKRDPQLTTTPIPTEKK